MRNKSLMLWVSAMALLMMARVFQMIMPESLPVFVCGLGSMGVSALIIIESALHRREIRKKKGI